MPDSVYTRFDIVSDICHPVPCYLNSNKVFLLLSDKYHNPEQGFKPGSLSECELEFDTSSKLLGHHGRSVKICIVLKILIILTLGLCKNDVTQRGDGAGVL